MSEVVGFSEESLARTSAEINRQNARDRANCWVLIERLGDVLLAETRSTGWLDARAMARTAKRHGIRWGSLLLDHKRMQDELRRFFDVCGIVSIGNVDVERIEDHHGKRSVVRVQFRRQFAVEKHARSVTSDNETTELEQAA